MDSRASIALLLEDEPLIAMDVEQMLEDECFDVTTVMSCEEASHWLAGARPDIVIVDIELRDGRSDKVVERLVEDNIPFIVYSGDHPSMHVDTPFAHGRWVNKPVAPEELVALARSLLSH